MRYNTPVWPGSVAAWLVAPLVFVTWGTLGRHGVANFADFKTPANFENA